jgi:HPt (histidine-containing phosphotransfer) domain-containing protein
MVGDRDKCMEAGMDDYISKPIDARKFSELISMWLPNKIPCTEQGRDNHSSDKKQEPSHTSPVDINHLETFTDGDKEVENQLFSLFLEQASISLIRLREAVVNNDNEEWRSASHKFKGASANLGAKRLSEICHSGEIAYLQNSDTKMGILNSIQSHYNEVEIYLEDRLGLKETV